MPCCLYRRHCCLQLCSSLFCQDRKVLFVLWLFWTRCVSPLVALLSAPGITCHLCHLVSKNRQCLFPALQPLSGVRTVHGHQDRLCVRLIIFIVLPFTVICFALALKDLFSASVSFAVSCPPLPSLLSSVLPHRPPPSLSPLAAYSHFDS